MSNRFIFHNYPDEKAVDIVKAATAALKPGARILINDSGLPDLGGIRWFDEKVARLVHWRNHMHSANEYTQESRYIGKKY